MHHQTFFCHLACSLPLVLSAVALQDETSCCRSPTGAVLLGPRRRACAWLRWLRPRTLLLGWLLLGTDRAGRHHSQPEARTQHLGPLKAQPDFFFLKRWKKPRAIFFISFKFRLKN